MPPAAGYKLFSLPNRADAAATRKERSGQEKKGENHVSAGWLFVASFAAFTTADRQGVAATGERRT